MLILPKRRLLGSVTRTIPPSHGRRTAMTVTPTSRHEALSTCWWSARPRTANLRGYWRALERSLVRAELADLRAVTRLVAPVATPACMRMPAAQG